MYCGKLLNPNLCQPLAMMKWYSAVIQNYLVPGTTYPSYSLAAPVPGTTIVIVSSTRTENGMVLSNIRFSVDVLSSQTERKQGPRNGSPPTPHRGPPWLLGWCWAGRWWWVSLTRIVTINRSDDERETRRPSSKQARKARKARKEWDEDVLLDCVNDCRPQHPLPSQSVSQSVSQPDLFFVRSDIGPAAHGKQCESVSPDPTRKNRRRLLRVVPHESHQAGGIA